MNTQLKTILDGVCQKENIEDYSVEIHGGNKAGEGFLGEITFLTFTDKSSGKNYNLVIKKGFENEDLRSINQVSECFRREIYLYTKVWPEFIKMQTEILGGTNGVFDKVVKCFSSSNEDKNEYLVLDNAKCLGFDLVSKAFILDSIHLKFIFENYARFHSISYMMQQKKPSTFEELKDNVKSMVLTKIMYSKENTMYLENILRLAKKSLLPEDRSKAIESKLDKFIMNWKDCFSESFYENARFKAIIHADCWSNNMMFKFDEKNNPKDIMLIDWQLASYGSPICDLSYCLYSGSRKEQYDQLDKYLDIYYQAFVDNLKKLKYDFARNPIPTLDQLKEDWIRYCKFGFAMGIMLIRVKAMTENEAVQLTEFDPETELQLEEEIKDEEINKRFRELLLHMYEINAL